jgi:hypothetical protein
MENKDFNKLEEEHTIIIGGTRYIVSSFTNKNSIKTAEQLLMELIDKEIREENGKITNENE